MGNRWSLTIVLIAESGYTEDEEWAFTIRASSNKAAKRVAMDTARQAVKDKLDEEPYNVLAVSLEHYLKFYKPHWKKVPPLGYQRFYQNDYKLRKHDIGIFITLHPFYKLHNNVQIPEWIDLPEEANNAN